MATEVIIGRSSVSPLKVPDDKIAVSGRHVRITISDNGIWKLEDLNTPNGTFIRDENGDFVRVYSKQIKDSDIIQLGNGGANSFTFTARRAFNPDDSYAYEFSQLQKMLKKSKEEEQKKEKRANITSWIISGGALLANGVIILISAILNTEPNPQARVYVLMLAPIILKMLFGNDSKAVKKVKKKREKFMICPNPKCSRRLSEFDIEQGQCSRCKAK